MYHLNFRKPGVSSPSKRAELKEGKCFSLCQRERWGQGMGTDGEELQAVATERKDAQCPGGMGWRLRAGRWSGSKVKTAWREEVGSHMCGGKQHHWLLRSEEQRTEGRRAKGRGCQLQTPTDSDYIVNRAEGIVDPSNLAICYSSDLPWCQHFVESLYHFQT